MTLEFRPTYQIEIDSCSTKAITAVFYKMIPLLLGELYNLILLRFAIEYMNRKIKPFSCACGNNEFFIWKTKHGKATTLTSLWGDVQTNQLQVQCKCCKKKMYITRKLLGLNPRQRVSHEVRRKLALMGALCSYRCVQTILRSFGSSISKTTVWKSVQLVGTTITMDLDTEGLKSGMADGTGIPIQGIKKRGLELKVFAQDLIGGGLRIAGLAIGKYESGWDAVFEPLRDQFEKMGEFHLILDGDKAILKGLKANIEVTVQRCLWHIPHQIKHYLWSDGITHKSDLWLTIMAKSVYLVTLPNQLLDGMTIESVLAEKKQQFDELIDYLEEHKCTACLSHIQNAWPDMFTNFERKLNGKTTSLIERVMRTVNLRINVGKWGADGALNMLRIRLAHYYNDYKVEESKEEVLIKKIA